MWALVLPKVKIDEALFVREAGRVGWAVRKGNSQLQAAIKDFDANYARKQGTYEYRLKQSMQHVKQVQDPTATTDWKRFEQMLALFAATATTTALIRQCLPRRVTRNPS